MLQPREVGIAIGRNTVSPARVFVFYAALPLLHIERRILTKNKKARDTVSGRKLRDRSGELLFIDARNLGYMKDRVLRDFKPEDIQKIVSIFHNWQSSSPLPLGEGKGEGIYENVPAFCYSAKLDEIGKQDYVLTPGRMAKCQPLPRTRKKIKFSKTNYWMCKTELNHMEGYERFLRARLGAWNRMADDFCNRQNDNLQLELIGF